VVSGKPSLVLLYSRLDRNAWRSHQRSFGLESPKDRPTCYRPRQAFDGGNLIDRSSVATRACEPAGDAGVKAPFAVRRTRRRPLGGSGARGRPMVSMPAGIEVGSNMTSLHGPLLPAASSARGRTRLLPPLIRHRLLLISGAGRTRFQNYASGTRTHVVIYHLKCTLVATRNRAARNHPKAVSLRF
jgi:hypothetical protein